MHDTARLDSIANNIASATFGVINEGKVRTVDMGGTLLSFDVCTRDSKPVSRICHNLGVYFSDYQKPLNGSTFGRLNIGYVVEYITSKPIRSILQFTHSLPEPLEFSSSRLNSSAVCVMARRLMMHILQTVQRQMMILPSMYQLSPRLSRLDSVGLVWFRI